MTVQINTGTTLGIVQGAPATEDAAGFGALTYVNVGEIESFSEFGNSATLTPFTAVDDKFTKQYVGATAGGTLTLTLGQDMADGGQTILADATTTTDASYGDDFSAEITFPDGTIIYYVVKIGSYTTNPGDVNAIVRSTVALAINTNPVIV